MATVTIDASTPSTKVNYAVLKSCCDRLLTMARNNQIQLGADEYNLLFEIVYAGTDGKTAAGSSSQAVITYA